MATYRYQFKGVCMASVNTLLPNHSATCVDFTPTILIDIEADTGDKDDLDEVMASEGYEYVSTL